MIALLASFENYNTSVFTLSHYTSFTVEVAQKVRLGIDPTVSALAVIIIAVTLFAALLREAYAGRGRPADRERRLGHLAAIAGNPAAVMATLFLVGVGRTRRVRVAPRSGRVQGRRARAAVGTATAVRPAGDRGAADDLDAEARHRAGETGRLR